MTKPSKPKLILPLAALLVTAVAGCGTPPFQEAILTPDGAPVRFSDIQAIIQNPDLTEEQKRDALIAIGITNEDLLDFLLSV